MGSDKPATGTPNIHRVFLLSHEEHPELPPRKITQIQCVSWPDFDVPEDPHTLLGLVKEVDHASDEMAADADDQGLKPPVLVHCKLHARDSTPADSSFRLCRCRANGKLYRGGRHDGCLEARTPHSSPQNQRHISGAQQASSVSAVRAWHFFARDLTGQGRSPGILCVLERILRRVTRSTLDFSTVARWCRQSFAFYAVPRIAVLYL